MNKSPSLDKQIAATSRENSNKDLSTSHSSIKSNKSTDNQVVHNSVSKNVSIKSEKDVHISKSLDKKTTHPDGTPKIPHKFITNWKQACDRTRDRTRELLKRWKTLPEFEANENLEEIRKKAIEEQEAHGEKIGWSVHVWSTFYFKYLF